MPDHTPRAFAPTIPCGEVADSSFDEFAAAAAVVPVPQVDELTDRELLLALLAEVQRLGQEVAALKARVK